MSERQAGRRVRLPAGAQAPIKVFVNGVEQEAGVDYRIDGHEVIFSRPIVKEEVSQGRWIAMLLGLFGSYGRHEVVDVEYRRDGRPQLGHDLAVGPD